ncbi:hypothetical protein [Acinetobacter baumannii]|uniref:hypothetical protein n=1 Tax=Acinetobacter baumannii TaxID=470 RepID=UPI00244C0208|nr:hypothetical protein [Acinetobacter baumannii]MDH2488074.1 hypothetical protein [Acinetobacter baumannii]
MSTSIYKIVKKRFSFLIAIVSAVLFWFTGDYYLTISTDNGPFEFIKMLAGIAGTLLGFLIGAVSLLTAVMDRTLIQNMRKNGQYNILVNSTFSACLSLLLLIVFCFFSFLVNQQCLKIMFSTVIFLSVYSALLVVAIGVKFKNIFVVMS